MNTLDAILTRRSCREFNGSSHRKRKAAPAAGSRHERAELRQCTGLVFRVVTDPEKLAQMADANGRPAEPLRKAAAGIWSAATWTGIPLRKGLLGH